MREPSDALANVLAGIILAGGLVLALWVWVG